MPSNNLLDSIFVKFDIFLFRTKLLTNIKNYILYLFLIFVLYLYCFYYNIKIVELPGKEVGVVSPARTVGVLRPVRPVGEVKGVSGRDIDKSSALSSS